MASFPLGPERGSYSDRGGSGPFVHGAASSAPGRPDAHTDLAAVLQLQPGEGIVPNDVLPSRLVELVDDQAVYHYPSEPDQEWVLNLTSLVSMARAERSDALTSSMRRVQATGLEIHANLVDRLVAFFGSGHVPRELGEVNLFRVRGERLQHLLGESERRDVDLDRVYEIPVFVRHRQRIASIQASEALHFGLAEARPLAERMDARTFERACMQWIEPADGVAHFDQGLFEDVHGDAPLRELWQAARSDPGVQAELDDAVACLAWYADSVRDILNLRGAKKLTVHRDAQGGWTYSLVNPLFVPARQVSLNAAGAVLRQLHETDYRHPLTGDDVRAVRESLETLWSVNGLAGAARRLERIDLFARRRGDYVRPPAVPLRWTEVFNALRRAEERTPGTEHAAQGGVPAEDAAARAWGVFPAMVTRPSFDGPLTRADLHEPLAYGEQPAHFTTLDPMFTRIRAARQNGAITALDALRFCRKHLPGFPSHGSKTLIDRRLPAGAGRSLLEPRQAMWKYGETLYPHGQPGISVALDPEYSVAMALIPTDREGYCLDVTPDDQGELKLFMDENLMRHLRITGRQAHAYLLEPYGAQRFDANTVPENWPKAPGRRVKGTPEFRIYGMRREPMLHLPVRVEDLPEDVKVVSRAELGVPPHVDLFDAGVFPRGLLTSIPAGGQVLCRGVRDGPFLDTLVETGFRLADWSDDAWPVEYERPGPFDAMVWYGEPTPPLSDIADALELLTPDGSLYLGPVEDPASLARGLGALPGVSVAGEGSGAGAHVEVKKRSTVAAGAPSNTHATVATEWLLTRWLQGHLQRDVGMEFVVADILSGDVIAGPWDRLSNGIASHWFATLAEALECAVPGQTIHAVPRAGVLWGEIQPPGYRAIEGPAPIQPRSAILAPAEVTAGSQPAFRLNPAYAGHVDFLPWRFASIAQADMGGAGALLLQAAVPGGSLGINLFPRIHVDPLLNLLSGRHMLRATPVPCPPGMIASKVLASDVFQGEAVVFDHLSRPVTVADFSARMGDAQGDLIIYGTGTANGIWPFARALAQARGIGVYLGTDEWIDHVQGRLPIRLANGGRIVRVGPEAPPTLPDALRTASSAWSVARKDEERLGFFRIG
jgi:hypothetical protein